MALDVRGSDSIYFKTGIDVTGLQSGATRAKGIVAGLASSITKMDVFAALSLSAVYAFAKISRAAYQFSKEFKHSMLEVSTISEMVANNFEGMSQKIINMSRRFPEDAMVLSKGLYQIASAGYAGAKSFDVLESSAKLAVAAVSDTFTTADAITSVMNAFGKEAGNVDEIADHLFTTVRLGKTTMRELGPVIGQITGSAAQLGITYKELMGIIAESVKTLPTPIALHGIRSMLMQLSQPQEDAVKMAKNLYGIELGMKRVREVGFKAFLTDILKATKDNKDALGEMFGNIRGLAAVMSIASDEGGRFSETLKEFDRDAGAVNKAFTIMSDSTTNKLKIMANQTKAILKPLGDWILDWVTKEVTGINKILGAIQNVETQAVKKKLLTQEGIGSLLGKSALKYKEKPVPWTAVAPMGGAARIPTPAGLDVDKRLKELQKTFADIGIEIPKLETRFRALHSAIGPAKWDIYESLVNDVTGAMENLGKAVEDVEEPVIPSGAGERDFIFPVSQEELDEFAIQMQLITEKENARIKAAAAEQLADKIAADEKYRDWKISANKELIAAEIHRLDDEMDLYTERENFDAGRIDEQKRRIEQLRRFEVDENRATLDTIIKDTRNMNKQELKLYAQFLKEQAALYSGNAEMRELILRKYDEIMQESYDAEIRKIREVGDALSSLGELIGKFDSKLGDSVQQVAAMADDVAGMAEAYATGNWLQGVSSTAGALTKLYTLFDRSAERARYEQLDNNALMRWVQQQRDYIDIMGKSAEAYERVIGEMELLTISKRDPVGGPMSTDQLNEVRQTLRDIRAEYEEMLTGTTTESIADSVSAGLMEGLDSVQMFADTFEDMMRNALLGAFKRRIISEMLDPFYAEFALLAEGGLTENEIANLKTMFLGGKGDKPGIADSIQEAWDAMGKMFESLGMDMTGGGEAARKTGMAGAIAGISEQTAGLLAGQFNAMRMNAVEHLAVTKAIRQDELIPLLNATVEIRDSSYYMRNIWGNSVLSVNALREIRDNTYYNKDVWVAAADMRDNISVMMSTGLENLQANQETAANSRFLKYLRDIDMKLQANSTRAIL